MDSLVLGDAATRNPARTPLMALKKAAEASPDDVATVSSSSRSPGRSRASRACAMRRAMSDWMANTSARSRSYCSAQRLSWVSGFTNWTPMRTLSPA